MRSPIYWASKALRAISRQIVPSRRSLRLCAYFSCVSVIGLLVCGRALHAAAREDAFSLGHGLIGLSDFTGGAEAVWLNGARFHHAVSSSNSSLHALLDRVEDHCRSNPGPGALVLAQLAGNDPKRFERHAPPGALRNAVFREEAATRGLVLCFVGGPNPTSIADWLSALRRFSQTRDLSSFGQLRYSFAESSGHEPTRVVSLWADSGLDLSRLFPKTGDAMGSDSPVVPRPPGGRRVLSARAEGMPFSVRSYESSQPLAATQSFYDTWMRGHGYRVDVSAESGSSSYLRADGYQVFLSVLAIDQRSFVTVTESGQSDTAAELELSAAP